MIPSSRSRAPLIAAFGAEAGGSAVKDVGAVVYHILARRSVSKINLLGFSPRPVNVRVGQNRAVAEMRYP